MVSLAKQKKTTKNAEDKTSGKPSPNHTLIWLSKLSFNFKRFKSPHLPTGPSSQHLKFCPEKSQRVGFKVESVHLLVTMSSIKIGDLCNLHTEIYI